MRLELAFLFFVSLFAAHGRMLFAQESSAPTETVSKNNFVCPQNQKADSTGKCWSSPQDYITANACSNFESVESSDDCLRTSNLEQVRWCAELPPARLAAIEYLIKTSKDANAVSRGVIALGMHYYQAEDNDNFIRIALFTETSELTDHIAKTTLLLNYADKVENKERKIQIFKKIAETCPKDDWYDIFARPSMIGTAGSSAMLELLELYEKEGDFDNAFATAKLALQRFGGGAECVTDTDNCGQFGHEFEQALIKGINRLPPQKRKAEFLRIAEILPGKAQLMHHTILMNFDLPGKDFESAVKNILASAGDTRKNWKAPITTDCLAKLPPGDTKLFEINEIDEATFEPYNEWDYTELSAKCLALQGKQDVHQ